METRANAMRAQPDGAPFSDALTHVKHGGKVARAGWNGKGMWIALKEATEAGLPGGMTLPFIFMCTAQGDFVPWLASQTDLLADDWMIVE